MRLDVPGRCDCGCGMGGVVDEGAAVVGVAEPVGDLAGGRVAQQHIVDVVAVEIADLGDLPSGRQCGQRMGAVVAQAPVRGAEPLGDLAGAAVGEQDVGAAVAVEIAGPGDAPASGKEGARVRGVARKTAGRGAQPVRDAAAVLPQDVADAVAVEVADSGYAPPGGDKIVRMGGVSGKAAGHGAEPVDHPPGVGHPQDVAAAVAVEVADAGHVDRG